MNQTKFDSLTEFLQTEVKPNGLVTVVDNGIPIDILVHPSPGSHTGLVLFHGAIDPKFTLPVFQGGGVTSPIKTNRIFISDPTLAIAGDNQFDGGGLTLGWHAGNYRQPNLQDTITKIIKKLFELLDVKKPVFHGISGGGFAALYYGAQFYDSVIVPCNPQTDIKHYLDWAVARWANVAFGVDINAEDPLRQVPRHIVTNVAPLYAVPVNGKVLFMQNSDDELHIEEHLKPFAARLFPTNEAYLLLDYWGPRHAQAPKELFTAVLQAAVDGAQPKYLEDLGFEKLDRSFVYSSVDTPLALALEIGEQD
ncbi:hypothetical protein [Corynebacterium sp. H130]|uniref:hypothetical protein n=1 Tax=Corynebacterium sp. H130 TaxID=3133444 RepID=UPI0030959618